MELVGMGTSAEVCLVEYRGVLAVRKTIYDGGGWGGEGEIGGGEGEGGGGGGEGEGEEGEGEGGGGGEGRGGGGERQSAAVRKTAITHNQGQTATHNQGETAVIKTATTAHNQGQTAGKGGAPRLLGVALDKPFLIMTFCEGTVLDKARPDPRLGGGDLGASSSCGWWLRVFVELTDAFFGLCLRGAAQSVPKIYYTTH
ncbi:hypothetical protein Pmani_035640 [Petrolisthes manimaculis]|uniref:Uncharacterized protein n=1 Tax=Petrolisthes manimaculis TaxID=1843537 RepID=A0AAE1TQA9_9EUCA|nr:hypothetical protein Pmani_035640 [Petrolisthes manimaculis]